MMLLYLMLSGAQLASKFTVVKQHVITSNATCPLHELSESMYKKEMSGISNKLPNDTIA